jgi:hypothetical protein
LTVAKFLEFYLWAGGFSLTIGRTDGKFRDSLQSEKMVLWTVFENLALSNQPRNATSPTAKGWRFGSLFAGSGQAVEHGGKALKIYAKRGLER